MNKGISYSKKLKWLFIGAPVLLVAVYFNNIQRTVVEYRLYKTFIDEEQEARNIPAQIKELQLQLDSTGIIVTGENMLRNSTDVLNYITTLCNTYQLKLTSYPQTKNIHDAGYELENYTITLRGTFHRLLQLINEMEKNRNSGKLLSAEFYITEDFVTRKRQLFLTLHLQIAKSK